MGSIDDQDWIDLCLSPEQMSQVGNPNLPDSGDRTGIEIRSPLDILENFNENAVMATIPSTHRTIHLLPRTEQNESIRKYEEILAMGITDTWITPSGAGSPECEASTGQPPSPWDDPMVVQAPCLHMSELEDAVDFLLIVQGTTGFRHNKVLVAHSRDEAAKLIFYQAKNGFAFVFACAMLKSASAKLFKPSALKEHKKPVRFKSIKCRLIPGSHVELNLCARLRSATWKDETWIGYVY